MPPRKLTVVISQAQGANPAKRQLEEDIAVAMFGRGDVEVSVVPPLVDMTADDPGFLFLRGVPGDVVVASWLYPRATQWVLDRQGVRGQYGKTLLGDEDGSNDFSDVPRTDAIRAAGPTPDRAIYCLDLRISPDAATFVDEIARIAEESRVEVATLTTLGLPAVTAQPPAPPKKAEAPKRRWYPVIDYSRCTNCMECIDFCLFGVYGVDDAGAILVEEQDSCKKGCPACSRVCPENAIMFPGHKTPVIAGADDGEDTGGFKLDLSKLFGAPEKDPLELAAAERDVELLRDGRDAVGMQVGLRRSKTRDAMDDLIDELDALPL
ncbi:MAG: ferredoxin family protein [Planctomycetota bacterium]